MQKLEIRRTLITSKKQTQLKISRQSKFFEKIKIITLDKPSFVTESFKTKVVNLNKTERRKLK